MKLERDGANIRVEIESGISRAAEPLGYILGVGQRVAKSHHSDRFLELSSNVAHPRANYFQGRPIYTAQQLQFIYHEKMNVLYILALLPSAGKNVPVLRY